MGLLLGDGGIQLGGGGGDGGGGGCLGGIAGAIFGLILIPLGVYMNYHSEQKLVNRAQVFRSVTMSSPEQAADASGLVKTKGQPQGKFISTPYADVPVIYIHHITEKYVKDKDSEGNVDYEWEDVDDKERWAAFTSGPIQVNGKQADTFGVKTVFKGLKPKGSDRFLADKWNSDADVGDRRIKVKVLPANAEIIVFGKISNGQIAGGETFVISALTPKATADKLQAQFKMVYWALKFGSTVAIALGLTLLFSPVLSLLSYIPILGGGLSCLLQVIIFLIAAAGVGAMTFLLRWTWYVVTVLGVGGAGALVLLIIAIRHGLPALTGSGTGRRQRQPSGRSASIPSPGQDASSQTADEQPQPQAPQQQAPSQPTPKQAPSVPTPVEQPSEDTEQAEGETEAEDASTTAPARPPSQPPRSATPADTGRQGTGAAAPPQKAPDESADSDELQCPNCGAKILITDDNCMNCGARLDEGELIE